MKPSASDIRRFSELLDPDKQEDPEEVAAFSKQLLEEAFSLYEGHEDHALLFLEQGVPIVVRGFSTELQATKWVQKQGLTEEEAVLAVVKTEGQA